MGQHCCLLSHRYAKLQQSHADDVTGRVHVADCQCLGLDVKEQKDKKLSTLAELTSGRDADVRTRGASYIGAVANILGENSQRDSLGVVLLLSLDYATVRLKNEGSQWFSLRQTHGH